MNTPSLYTLSSERRELARLLDSLEDDAFTEETVKSTLDAIDCEIALKVPDIAAVVLDTEFLAKSAKDAADKMKERAARIQKRADALRAYMLTHLLALPEEKQKIETEEFTVAVRKNPPSVEILEGSEKVLPPEYLREPPKVEVLAAQLRALIDVVTAVGKYEATPIDDTDGLQAAHAQLARALEAVVASGLPQIPKYPDKTKISDALKLRREVSELERLEIEEPKKLTPAKREKLRSLRAALADMPKLDGCRLITGFRLAIER